MSPAKNATMDRYKRTEDEKIKSYVSQIKVHQEYVARDPEHKKHIWSLIDPQGFGRRRKEEENSFPRCSWRRRLKTPVVRSNAYECHCPRAAMLQCINGMKNDLVALVL